MSTHPGHVTVTGLVGGVAAGKSEVARDLEFLGAVRIDADVIVHEILRDPEVVAALTDRLGDAVLAANGEIDRGALADVVFGDAEALSYLESLIHPRVRRRIEERLEEAPSGSVVVIDAPLLVESGLDAVCDVVVMVATDPARRESRAVTDRGWSEGEVGRRERHQTDVARKRRRADVVIENDGSREDLRREVESLWERLRAHRSRGDGPRRTG